MLILQKDYELLKAQIMVSIFLAIWYILNEGMHIIFLDIMLLHI